MCQGLTYKPDQLFEVVSGADHISEPCVIKENNPKYLGAKIQGKRLYSGYYMDKLNPPLFCLTFTKKKPTQVNFDS